MSLSGNWQVLMVEQHQEWLAAIKGTKYDFYHLPSYHQLSAHPYETPQLFVYEEGRYCIALPLLLRPLHTILPFAEQFAPNLCDATSVYGYAGPVASHLEIPASVSENFRSGLHQAMRDLNVVSVFSRLHPLLPQVPLLDGLGECLLLGQTVSIDTLDTDEVQRGGYRKGHRYEIKRLQRMGVKCERDIEKRYLDEFIEIYHETMSRVQAQSLYFFDPEYFEQLIYHSDSNVELFVALSEGQVVSAALFLVCNDIVQYHLAGTRQSWMKMAPMKLILDTVRQWASEQKMRVFHLGGGVGSQEDSLFAFKAGFSEQRYPFHVWRWIALPEIYAQICAAKAEWNLQKGMENAVADFFPEYRIPSIPTSLT